MPHSIRIVCWKCLASSLRRYGMGILPLPKHQLKMQQSNGGRGGLNGQWNGRGTTDAGRRTNSILMYCCTISLLTVPLEVRSNNRNSIIKWSLHALILIWSPLTNIDAWRVVSNYTEDDIKQYYSGISVESSGVQKYDWEDNFLSTRHLDFDSNQHKILETELKMLCELFIPFKSCCFSSETHIMPARLCSHRHCYHTG